MQKLIEFLLSRRHWLMFILCEVFSLVLVFQYNAYHRDVFVSSTNVMSGYVVSVTGYIRSYINLREENKVLLDRAGELELEAIEMEQQLMDLRYELQAYEDLALPDSVEQRFSYVSATVVNNSVNRAANYITINKGSKDGIKPDMGVVSTQGVVGIVSNVSEHFSVIISLLNPKSRLSCKPLNGEFYSSLYWDGRDPRYAHLSEVPNHATFQPGDTIVTSGYSATFPPGMTVGRVLDADRTGEHNFYSLKVELATDFRRLKHVRVISNDLQREWWELEQTARRND
jgi:rod shape-determining protein MreC